MEPWETMHAAAHTNGVEALNESIEKVRQAAGWIGVLPETTEHVSAMLEAIGNQLASVLRQVDRPTILGNFDKEVKDFDLGIDESMVADIESVSEAIKPKVYRFDATGDIEKTDR